METINIIDKIIEEMKVGINKEDLNMTEDLQEDRDLEIVDIEAEVQK